ncbi:hypothetical protein [Nocardia pseudobrasiliensis]|uniref:DUF4231 domain-containing protein n=1 Tax=Nocardia pseudobrasiliensis TaxID=45979 RepID=A0A370HYB1_9NOCA|nr:hypothetical protein [Nocardia pseudobrasiliensis]RDI63475.1 hypothetical protein DFR76_110172 [Nocardia pseudobrasiliensis]
MAGDIDAIKAAIQEFKGAHNAKLDSFLFNGGTLIALAASIAAAAPWPGDISWAPRVLAGITAFVIGAERTLNFGERWRFHLRMSGAAEALRVRLDHVVLLEEAEAAKEVSVIVRELGELYRSNDVPAPARAGADR